VIELHVALALVPVLAFLGALMLMDSFKLVPPWRVLVSVGWGAVAALVAYVINDRLLAAGLHRGVLTHAVAPLVEESLKALAIVLLVRRARVGFLVDAAIHGFAAGSGFAVVEGVYYLSALGAGQPLAVWIVRGLGTAIMHGSATALVGIVAKDLTDRHESVAIQWFLPGLAVAIACHALYNTLLSRPILATEVMVVLMPLLLGLTFRRSEGATRDWLGRGFDADGELLELIETGAIADTPAGAYLESLRERFPGPVVADMLCLLQLHAELSMRAKGALIARAAGVELPPDAEVADRFREMHHLERTIGPTGRLALMPLRPRGSRELWELTMLQKP